jgi:thiosulfate reductase cytochrome b subunit
MKLARYQMREEVGVEGVPALFVAAAVEGNAYDLSRLRLLHTACCFTLLYSALLCFTLIYSPSTLQWKAPRTISRACASCTQQRAMSLPI